MTHQEPVHSTVERFDIDRSEAARSSLAAEQLEQLSDLVAQGEVPFPSDLTPDEFQRLLFGVARRRRKWLVKLIGSVPSELIT